MERECFCNGRLNMPRGHHGFAAGLICERNARPAHPVGDVGASDCTSGILRRHSLAVGSSFDHSPRLYR
jgi:hypothetical protein